MNTRAQVRDIVCKLGALFVATACVDAGTSMKSVELRVAGNTRSVIPARNGWQVTLERARLAFGPLWLCAGKTAGELCDVARAEWLDAVVVDALDDEAKTVGELWGSEGDVRSWMYDYGLVSLLTTPKPHRTEAANNLGGNSVDVVGCASKQEQRVCFALRLPVAQSTAAEQGVPVVRVSGNGNVLTYFGTDQRLTLVFDAADWVGTIDFDGLPAANGCEGDCEPVALEADSQAARAVRSALEGTARPELVWKR